MANHLSEIFVC